MEPIKTIEYKGYSIQIFQDDCGESPRNWDNLGVMFCKHRNYSLGDKNAADPRENPDEIYMALPLYLYDHGCISISTKSFVGRAHHAEWDSGQVGLIYVTKDSAAEFSNFKKAKKEKVQSCLEAEVEAYNQYLIGNVYGYRIKGPEHKCPECGHIESDKIDSCWGYYGHDHEKSGLLESARAAIDYHIETQGKTSNENLQNSH
jgi:hypothetical protein